MAREVIQANEGFIKDFLRDLLNQSEQRSRNLEHHRGVRTRPREEAPPSDYSGADVYQRDSGIQNHSEPKRQEYSYFTLLFVVSESHFIDSVS